MASKEVTPVARKALGLPKRPLESWDGIRDARQWSSGGWELVSSTRSDWAPQRLFAPTPFAEIGALSRYDPSTNGPSEITEQDLCPSFQF